MALRWVVQSGAVFTTSTTSATHLAEDAAIFDFALSADEMAQLDRL